MKLTILIQGACYQAGLIGSLHVLKRFRNLFRFQAEIRANRLLSSSGGGGLLFCKEGCTEREATSQAKCAAGITSGGNHTRGSARLSKALTTRCYSGWFPGDEAETEKAGSGVFCIYQPALPSCWVIHWALAVPWGNIQPREKPRGGKEIGKEKLSPPRSERHLFRATHSHRRQDLKCMAPQGLASLQSHRHLELLRDVI